jgi:hypothetical protein
VQILSPRDGNTFCHRTDLTDMTRAGVTLATSGTRLYTGGAAAGTRKIVVISSADDANFDQREIPPHRMNDTPGLTPTPHPFYAERLVLDWTGVYWALSLVLDSATALFSLATGVARLFLKSGAGQSYAYQQLIFCSVNLAVVNSSSSRMPPFNQTA